MHARQILRDVLSLPKTVFFNFSVLPFVDAIRLPFYVDRNIAFGKLYKNVVDLDFPIKMFSIKFGKWALDGIPEMTKGYISMGKYSKIVFRGNAEFAYGISLSTTKAGKIYFGRDFYCNKNCVIACLDLMDIGHDVLFGWNVSVIDNDGGTHKTYENGIEKCNKRPVKIGDHSWLCANTHILKGVIIPENTIVAYNSCVTKAFEEKNTILAGSPAKVLTRNIEWKR